MLPLSIHPFVHMGAPLAVIMTTVDVKFWRPIFTIVSRALAI